MLNNYILDDLFEFINGGAWTEQEYADEGIHVVKVTNLINGSVERRDDSYLPISKYDKYKKHKLHEGDVVVATVGSHPTQQGSVVGRTSRIPKDFDGSFLNQNAVCLRVKRPDLVCDRYFYLLTKTVLFKYHIEGRAKGSANQVRMALGDLKKFSHNYPELNAQKKIAAILSAYDDLIEINKRRIALLENMAEEIYREWFVRFRFPGYQTAKFEKGIPKGWSLERIDSLGTVITGKTPSTTNSKYYGGEIPFVKTPDMHGNMFVYETEELLTEDGLNSQPSQILEKNAICVSCIGTGGVVSMTTERCSTNQQINSLTLNTVTDKEWAFFTLKALKPTILAFGATGATMTNLSKGKFAGIKAIIPNKDLRLEFSKIINPMFEKIEFLSMLNKNLTSTKGSLLPRLISGKLSVESSDIQFPPSMQEDIINTVKSVA